MENQQFPSGTSRLTKLGHWSLVGGAPESEGPVTRGFCRTASYGVIPCVLVFAAVAGTVNAGGKALGKEERIIDFGLNDLV